MLIAELKDLTKDFGGLRAVSNLSFKVNRNEILGLIGPNGSGKTTVFNLMSGVIKPTKGEIKYLGKNIVGLKAHKIARMGLTRTFQHTVMWDGLTVLEHVALGGFYRSKINIWEAIINRKKYLYKENKVHDICREMLNIVGLEKYKNEFPKNLSYGHQKLLGLSIALANQPALLLLDEPAAGLNPTETFNLMDILKKILKLGITIVLVEHHMKLVMGLCDRIVVINFGAKIAGGTPLEVCNDQKVIKAYLGE